MRAAQVILIAMLAGCASTQRIADEARYIDERIASGEAAMTIKAGKLTETQLLTVTHAANAYEALRQKWKPVELAGALADEAMAAELMHDYRELEHHYRKLRSIVVDAWDSYPEDKKQQLTDDMSHVESLSYEVDRLLAARRYMEALREILQVAKALAKTGAAL